MRKIFCKRICALLCSFVMVAVWFSTPMGVRADDYPTYPTLGTTSIYQYGSSSYISDPSFWFENNKYTYPLKICYTYSDECLRMVKWNSDLNGWQETDCVFNSAADPSAASDAFTSAFVDENTESDINNYIRNGYAMYWVGGPDPRTFPDPSTSPDPSTLPDPSLNDGSLGEAHTHNWVYGTICEATEETDGLEGYQCSCGARKDTTPILAGDVIIMNNYRLIDWSYPGKTTVLNMKRMCNLSQAFMKRLASKNNCDFTIKMIYENKEYEFYIPAGAKFETSEEYYGPKKLMEMFKYKQVR